MTNSDVEIAWAAGWFEGEGCISGSGDATIHVLATSTDLDVLTRFAQIVGVGRIVKSKDQPGRKPKWDWYVTAGDAVEVLRAFLPYLGERRRARAVEKIDARERFEAMVSAPRVCPGCGEEFIPERPKSPLRLYCKPECRRKVTNQRAYLKARARRDAARAGHVTRARDGRPRIL